MTPPLLQFKPSVTEFVEAVQGEGIGMVEGIQFLTCCGMVATILAERPNLEEHFMKMLSNAKALELEE